MYAQLREDEFIYEGFNPEVSSRDAERVEGGFSYSYLFAKKKAGVNWRIAYEENDATGLNFNRQAYKTSINLRFPTIWDIQLKLSAKYEEHEYPNFLGPVMRENRYKHASELSFSRWFR